MFRKFLTFVLLQPHLSVSFLIDVIVSPRSTSINFPSKIFSLLYDLPDAKYQSTLDLWQRVYRSKPMVRVCFCMILSIPAYCTSERQIVIIVSNFFKITFICFCIAWCRLMKRCIRSCIVFCF